MSFEQLKSLVIAEIAVSYSTNIKASERVQITSSKDAKGDDKETGKQEINKEKNIPPEDIEVLSADTLKN